MAPIHRTGPYSMLLDQTPTMQLMHVQRVLESATMPHLARQLEEIGFLAGEPVQILRRAMPGGDPMVVRIGISTFALRCAEAQCVEVVAAPSAVVAPDGAQHA